MKILFLAEFFYPFAHGGSEWSIYYLAKSLIKKGHHVSILTPNFGTSSQGKKNGIFIYRLPFPIKLDREKPRAISPFWFTNILFQLFSIIWVIRLVIKLNIDIIHVQGNYFIPAAYISGKILRKPVIVTVRDYQILCPYGFCLDQKRNYKSCNICEYFLNDVRFYLKNYCLNCKAFKRILIFVSSVRAIFIKIFLSLFLRRINKIVCISKKQEKIFNRNGFLNTAVIYNSIEVSNKVNITGGNNIFYAGRLTPGKGVELLLKSCGEILENDKKLNLIIAGEGLLKKRLMYIAKENGLERQVKFLGQISHQKVLEYISKAKVVVIPSVWEEPFGRVALEAQALGVPVVATDRGGLPEIVENGLTGYVVKATTEDLKKGIRKSFKNNAALRRKINQHRINFKQKFQTDITNSYIKLYQSI